MTHGEIRDKFLKFFELYGHKIVPSSSLLPTDPSVLFTTAGMQQFKDYYTGQADATMNFGSLNTVSIQKCIRTSDIDEVGDESHLTFFEMLGNFSFGGYGKREAIEYAHDFLVKELGLKINYVSAFGGDPSISSRQAIPADDESEKIWRQVAPGIEIKRLGREDNFWGPTGNEGPCGPTTEIWVKGSEAEVWNLVFNQYYQKPDGTLQDIPLGIDTGMGLERLITVSQKVKTIFDTDLLGPVFKLTPAELDIRTRRIIADHSRAIMFLITDGVRPSNKEQGYILRRLMRRVVTYFFSSPVDNRLRKSVINRSDSTIMHDIFAKIVEIYEQYYPELNANMIIHEFDNEKEKFEKTLRQGLKELNKLQNIDAPSAFRLYESFGLPYEVIKEVGDKKAEALTRSGFEQEMEKHREISRAGAEKKFGGHGLSINFGELRSDLNEEELKRATRLHTATHLLHASLRKILGNEVRQAGSDITPERLRFDFTFLRKVTPEELRQVEDIVNEAVQKDYPVIKKEMSYEDAVKSGALAFFKLKYPPRVNVYSIGPKPTKGLSFLKGQSFSRELCGGPHVSNTLEIGKFKIIKEESISAGVRRIRAIVE